MRKDIGKLAEIGEGRLRYDVVTAMRNIRKASRERKPLQFKDNVIKYREAIRNLEDCGIDTSKYTTNLEKDLKDEPYLTVFRQMIKEE